MVKLLHLSDIHLGSGFCHGRLNPDTGLNTRLEDFTTALAHCIDRALAEPVDAVLFGGDAFPDATPPPLVQQAFARQFRRLADANIPAVLLVGNHDQHAQGQGGASLCLYRTLGVPGMVVGDRLQTHRIDTCSGPLQVITLPWLTPSTLLTRPDIQGLSLAEVNQQLISRLRVALEGEIRQLDTAVPAVLLAHAMVDAACYGAERFLAAGKGFTVPLALLAQPCFDYVALGHVHRHQVLCDHPLTLYPGSIERVDFSEEAEAKGYVLVDVQRGVAQAQFQVLPTRPFHTLRLDLSAAEDPEAMLVDAIATAPIQDAVVRLIYTLRPDQLEQIRSQTLDAALAAAHTYTIQPEVVSQLTRSRMPDLGTDSSIEPVMALQRYLVGRDDLTDIAPAMVAAAAELLAVADGKGEEDMGVDAGVDAPTQQLRLL